MYMYFSKYVIVAYFRSFIMVPVNMVAVISFENW